MKPPIKKEDHRGVIPYIIARVGLAFPIRKNKLKEITKSEAIVKETPWGTLNIWGSLITARGQAVLMALIHIAINKEPPNPLVECSYYKVLKLLGIPPSKNAYEALREDIIRIFDTRFIIQTKGQTLMRNFIEEADVDDNYDEEFGDNENRPLLLEKSTRIKVRLAGWIMGFYDKHRISRVDLHFLHGIKSDVGQLIYGILITQEKVIKGKKYIIGGELFHTQLNLLHLKPYMQKKYTEKGFESLLDTQKLLDHKLISKYKYNAKADQYEIWGVNQKQIKEKGRDPIYKKAIKIGWYKVTKEKIDTKNNAKNRRLAILAARGMERFVKEKFGWYQNDPNPEYYLTLHPDLKGRIDEGEEKDALILIAKFAAQKCLENATAKDTKATFGWMAQTNHWRYDMIDFLVEKEQAKVLRKGRRKRIR